MRSTKAVIHLDAMQHNARLAKESAPESLLIGVIKADAYGHGAVQAAQALNTICDAFAVAFLDEAVSLMENGVLKPLLLLEGFTTDEELECVGLNGFWTVIHHPYQVDILRNYQGPELEHVTLKVDTGMHRLGLMPDEADALITELKQNDRIKELSLTTHFSCSDELDKSNTQSQINKILALAERHDLGIAMANSAGILGWPQSRATWNRAGIMLYGATPFETSHPLGDQLKAVMSLEAPVIALREIAVGECVGYGRNWSAQRPSLIATLAIGYADGYPRAINAGTEVWINNQRAPIVGNVSMDMITIDVTDVHHVGLGSKVELWGKNICVNEIAAANNTIGYELLTKVTARVPRSYEGL
ncbi:alanine racemase [Temperatibacter marinus]|uniref:Alanine racemase n=1 Tax=Temperatibacter marinus TaxID=1456591 RepID=A0AA52EE99_9PROT|nr:alanine racemase [Temperatibacter marinus]WND01488.1 alanine racemase [Temperatibacter marinus]